MDAKQRLLDLFGETNFKILNSSASVEEFKEIARYNQEQYARIEEIGDYYQERILNLMCLVLAEKLHPLAVNGPGDTSKYSLRRILAECFCSPGMKLEWGKYKQLALTALSGEGLDAKQTTVIGNIIDGLPDMIIDLLVEFAGRLEVIPIQDVSSFGIILAQMMKEGEYADNSRSN